VSSISADSYGFVTINQVAGQGVHGFFVVGPDGSEQEDGGGDYFMINPINGMIPANYPWPTQLPGPVVKSWPK
jgi:hypothetical protein